jgi:hypothetical protein
MVVILMLAALREAGGEDMDGTAWTEPNTAEYMYCIGENAGEDSVKGGSKGVIVENG